MRGTRAKKLRRLAAQIANPRSGLCPTRWFGNHQRLWKKDSFMGVYRALKRNWSRG